MLVHQILSLQLPSVKRNFIFILLLLFTYQKLHASSENSIVFPFVKGPCYLLARITLFLRLMKLWSKDFEVELYFKVTKCGCHWARFGTCMSQ